MAKPLTTTQTERQSSGQTPNLIEGDYATKVRPNALVEWDPSQPPGGVPLSKPYETPAPKDQTLKS